MSEFEKWLEENYPIAGLDMCEKEGDRYTHKPTRNMHDAYLAGQQTKEAAIQEMDEVIKMQDADLRKYEKQIESLKEQLNNMEACYIEKKKELEDQHKKVDEVLEYLDGESANRWGLWKEKADMLDQGASNAFEEAYWMVKKALRGES